MMFPPAACPRIVVKVGSALLVDPDGQVRRAWLGWLVADIAARVAAGQQVTVVSSGAIALGARRLGLTRGGRASLDDAQAAAATGQIALAGAWASLLEAQGLVAAQILVTLDDLEDRRRYLNASATLARLMTLRVVPVVNENDSVATEEIRFGDNDRLAARVAQAAGARGVVLLSDVDGLYDRNPSDPDAVHVPRIDRIDAVAHMADAASASGMGSGGMVSKIAAARIATAAGIDLAIASGRVERPLSGDHRHSLFVAEDRDVSARKAWLGGGLTAKGVIHVDAGAAAALARGGSLLAAGTVRIEGSFGRGDVVTVAAPSGPVARGLAEYDAADAAALVGRRSDEQAAILGYAPRAALVHRSHLVML